MWLVHLRVNFADSNIPLSRGDIPLRRGDSWKEVLFYSAQHYCFVWLSLLSQHCFQQQQAAFLRGKKKVNTGVGRDQNRAQRRVVLCQRVSNQTPTEWFGASKCFSTFCVCFTVNNIPFLFDSHRCQAAYELVENRSAKDLAISHFGVGGDQNKAPMRDGGEKRKSKWITLLLRVCYIFKINTCLLTRLECYQICTENSIQQRTLMWNSHIASFIMYTKNLQILTSLLDFC